MSYSTRGSSGGGGGFGGFPYRSAHQQGTDGSSNNSRNNNRRKKYVNRQKRGGPITCQIRVQVPAHRIGIIVGRHGTTVKRLVNETKCVFDIPKQQQQQQQQQERQSRRNDTVTNERSHETRLEHTSKIVVKASCVAHLLHACWCIANLILNKEAGEGGKEKEHSEGVKYTMTLQSLPDISIQGVLSKPIEYDDTCNQNDFDLQSFMTGTDTGEHCVSAYCVHSDRLDQDQISTILDNELFVDPSISASVEVIQLSDKEHDNLIFVYGTPNSKADFVYKTMLSHSFPK